MLTCLVLSDVLFSLTFGRPETKPMRASLDPPEEEQNGRLLSKEFISDNNHDTNEDSSE